MSATQRPVGVSFLVNPVGTETIFTPEQFTDDHRAFAATAEQFMLKEVHPFAEELERQADDNRLMVAKVRKAGELGFLMADIPEAYGGLGVDKTTSMLVAEKIATYLSFSVSLGAHAGIGTLPIVYFGNEAQKQRYLPLLATGELLAAYALTEPSSGSDALGARTTATLVDNGDGTRSWSLNGTKMWITNSGFADLFIVFAKVDGKQFSAFIVPRSTPGLSTGAEERKMGIKGSSTRMLILEDVRVPEENLLGEVGRGHKIAFNILNVGRFKLGVAMLGMAKYAMGISVRYAGERVAFGAPIATFGAIRTKIAAMQKELFVLESMSYRIAGYMDAVIDTLDSSAPDYPQHVMAAIEEFAVEDSILKVYGSEVASRVIDEGVQIHGGYGFSQEYEIERLYRDARINRIYEGTNEVNRLLIPGMIIRRGMSGQLDLMGLLARVQASMAAGAAAAPEEQGLAREAFVVEQCKAVSMHVANLAIQKHMTGLEQQQALMLGLADMLMAVYGADCTVARVLQAGDGARAEHVAAARLAVDDAQELVHAVARRLLPSLVAGGDLAAARAAVAGMHAPLSFDRLAAEEALAASAVAQGGWSLS